MNSNNQHCDEFEPMVSAMLDGELSTDELAELTHHLNRCESCAQLANEFRNINAAMSHSSLPESQPEIQTFVVTRHKPALKNWMSVWRLVPIGAVAALMVGLFFVTTQSPPEATAEQLSPDQFVKPLADLNRINHQQQRDQELMLRTLGMDLRALKLELKQLENAGDDDRTRFENRIDEMLKRVRQFESNELAQSS